MCTTMVNPGPSSHVDTQAGDTFIETQTCDIIPCSQGNSSPLENNTTGSAYKFGAEQSPTCNTIRTRTPRRHNTLTFVESMRITRRMSKYMEQFPDVYLLRDPSPPSDTTPDFQSPEIVSVKSRFQQTPVCLSGQPTLNTSKPLPKYGATSQTSSAVASMDIIMGDTKAAANLKRPCSMTCRPSRSKKRQMMRQTERSVSRNERATVQSRSRPPERMQCRRVTRSMSRQRHTELMPPAKVRCTKRSTSLATGRNTESALQSRNISSKKELLHLTKWKSQNQPGITVSLMQREKFKYENSTLVCQYTCKLCKGQFNLPTPAAQHMVDYHYPFRSLDSFLYCNVCGQIVIGASGFGPHRWAKHFSLPREFPQCFPLRQSE